jgi:uncharacterized membrane protein
MADANDIVKAARKATPSANQLNNPKGLAAAGAALIALPYAAQGIAKLTGAAADKSGDAKPAELGKRAGRKATEKAKEAAGDVAEERLKPSLPKGLGGLGSIFSGGPFRGDSKDDDADGGGGAAAGHGSGRRMPIQQAVDVAVPMNIAYNLWTQFEEWPSFMHRVDSVEQVDETTVAMSTKIWGITKRFDAEIVEQRPDERIEWDVNQGLAHSGVVTFHELAPRLTRVEISLDVNPDSLLEKAGRGMRFTKRAVRGDLHRFKAYAELEEEAEEGWRGTIEDGEVKSKPKRKSGGSSANGRSSRRPSAKGANGSGPKASKSSKSRSRS